MTFTKPSIDASNGYVTSVDGRIICPDTKVAELDTAVYCSETYRQENVKRTIARTDGVSVEGTVCEVEAVFEDNRLSKVFITISPPEHRNLTDDQWYAADRRGFHERWLTKQIGKDWQFDWGYVDVGEDKSADVKIGVFYNLR